MNKNQSRGGFMKKKQIQAKEIVGHSLTFVEIPSPIHENVAQSAYKAKLN